jgi:hypothetical protein
MLFISSVSSLERREAGAKHADFRLARLQKSNVFRNARDSEQPEDAFATL